MKSSESTLIVKPFSTIKTSIERIVGRVMHDVFVVTDNNQICVAVVKGIEVILTWICNAISVKEVHLNEETSEYIYTVEFDTIIQPITINISKGLITKRNFYELAKHGFNYNEALTDEVIKFIILEEENARPITDSSFIGWNNSKFIGYPQENRKYTGTYKLGVSNGYDVKRLNELLDDAYYLQFCIVAGASSCIISYLGQKIPLTTPIVHFYEDSGKGKTTGLMAGISVWGKPDVNGGLFSTWNQTENHLMEKLSNNFAVALALDDASICKYDLTTMIYNISQGINRQRLNKSGKPNETKQWLTCLLSNGEMGLLEKTKKNNGLKARVFEFRNPVTLNAEHSNEVKRFTQSNYGYIGRKLIEKLENSIFDEIEEQFQNKKQDFLDLLLIRQPKNPITERLADYYAIWMLTADILKNDLSINIDESRIRAILFSHHFEMSKTFSIGEAVYNVLCSYIIRNHDKFHDSFNLDGVGTITRSAEGKFVERYEVIILSTVVEKILKAEGFPSVRMCLKELYKLGVLVKQREDTYHSKRCIGGILADVIHLKLNENYMERIDSYEIY